MEECPSASNPLPRGLALLLSSAMREKMPAVTLLRSLPSAPHILVALLIDEEAHRTRSFIVAWWPLLFACALIMCMSILSIFKDLPMLGKAIRFATDRYHVMVICGALFMLILSDDALHGSYDWDPETVRCSRFLLAHGEFASALLVAAPGSVGGYFMGRHMLPPRRVGALGKAERGSHH